MSQTALIVFICITGLGLLGGLSAIFIDWVELIARLFRDKAHIGYMEVFNGKGYDLTTGRRLSADLYGEIFTYTYEGLKYEVRIGKNYPARFIKRKRLIRCRPGYMIALPIGPDNNGYDAKGEPLEPQFTESEIGLQTYGFALVELNKSIRGKTAGGLLTFILIGVIVVMVIIGVWYYQGHKSGPASIDNQTLPGPALQGTSPASGPAPGPAQGTIIPASPARGVIIPGGGK